MTARKPSRSIHAKCLAVARKDGYTLVCGKSPEHIRSEDPKRREHYDTSADERWDER